MKINTVKGFRDFIGDDARKRAYIKSIIEEQFLLYGYEPSETPVIENENFVIGDNFNDDAVRDIYRLEDRAKRKLALRYEFTFQLKRISKNQKLPFKRYQIGYNFRDEPIKKGRLRQFIQCDCDIVGSTIKDEAEMLYMIKSVLDKIKIKSTIFINNRKLLDEILEDEKIPEKNREQVIKELDKLGKLTKAEVAFNLKSLNAEKLLKLLDEGEKYFTKYRYFDEIKKLKRICSEYGIDIKFNPTLARGLSYYNGNIFEVYSEDIDVSIGGGGGYTINDMQSTGISLGLEPIFLISKIKEERVRYLIASLNQDDKAIGIAKKLREKGFSTLVLFDKTISKFIEYANIKKIENIIFVGENEVNHNKYKIKNMDSGKEVIYSFEDF